MNHSGWNRNLWCFLSTVLFFFLPACQQNETVTDNIWHPVIGLNESHSKSWAQIAKNGVTGITTFQKLETDDDEGTLTYQAIQPDGTETSEEVASGRGLEISILLFDKQSNPHIFTATSTDSDQTIIHHFKNGGNQWMNETIIHFQNQGGVFIYELSGDTGPDDAFHLLVLKTRSRIDSDSNILSNEYMDAYIDAHLFHVSNENGGWEKKLIHKYDMNYTYDMYIKILTRQDIKADHQGFVHVAFGEQINGDDYEHSSSRLCYATNKTGNWIIETALNPAAGTRDDAGWFPSLSLNKAGTPYISCMYLKRVPTGSAAYSQLLLLNRIEKNNWETEIIAEHDDGYYGKDGRNYTGALSHLVFDATDIPHIVFSDVASFHEKINDFVTNILITGNIRHALVKNGDWVIETIFPQPVPNGFFDAEEMHGICLLIPENSDAFRVTGQEVKITEKNNYTCNLVHVPGN